MRDSAAPRSYVDWRSRAFSDSRAWLRKARSYIKPREERVRYLLVASWAWPTSTSRSIPLLGSRGGPGDHTARRAFERSRDTVTWWKSRRYGITWRHGADAVSNHKSARVKISTEAPPPKSIELRVFKKKKKKKKTWEKHFWVSTFGAFLLRFLVYSLVFTY